MAKACKTRRKRGPAKEPLEYVDDIKKCPFCLSTEHCKFKFLNNNKPDQPRYQCLKCKGWHTHYGKGKDRKRPHGKKYTKLRLIDPPEVQLLERKCQNKECGAVNNARFLYYNNKDFKQPRFMCRECGGKFQAIPWKFKKEQRTEISEENYENCIQSAPIMQVQQQYSENLENMESSDSNTNILEGIEEAVCPTDGHFFTMLLLSGEEQDSSILIEEQKDYHNDGIQSAPIMIPVQQQYSEDYVNLGFSYSNTMMPIQQQYSEDYVNLGPSDSNIMVQVQQQYSEDYVNLGPSDSNIIVQVQQQYNEESDALNSIDEEEFLHSCLSFYNNTDSADEEESPNLFCQVS